MKKKKTFYTFSIIIIVSLFLGFAVTAFTYKIMTVTSSPAFCASCHEIAPAVESWRTSSHASNEFGFKADCMDCHLPPPEKTFEFFFMKTKHGLKDVFAHFFHGEYDREKMQKRVHDTIENSVCLNCHSEFMYIQNNRGAMKAHREAYYSDPMRSCMECHAPLVHIERSTYSAAGKVD